MRTKNFNVNLDLCNDLFCKLQFIEVLVRDIEGDNYDMVITSAKDGKHMTGSKHYSGEAIDIRIKDMKNPKDVFGNIKTWLDYNFDIILEKDHIHIEYDINK